MNSEIFPNLINKQVNCYSNIGDKLQINKNLLGLLSIMYPTFRIVYSDFDIYYGEPFIYAGDPKWINKINKRTEPHITLAPTGEYDLNNKQTLIDLAYSKHNKKQPQYLKELIDTWDDDTFYYNWKILWLLGTVPDKEIQKNDLFFKIISNLSNPIKIPEIYLEIAQDDESVKYLENMLISFILKSKDISEENTKNKSMLLIRNQFRASYSKNIALAVQNLIDSNIKSKRLSNLNFILNLALGDSYYNSRS